MRALLAIAFILSAELRGDVTQEQEAEFLERFTAARKSAESQPPLTADFFEAHSLLGDGGRAKAFIARDVGMLLQLKNIISIKVQSPSKEQLENYRQPQVFAGMRHELAKDPVRELVVAIQEGENPKSLTVERLPLEQSGTDLAGATTARAAAQLRIAVPRLWLEEPPKNEPLRIVDDFSVENHLSKIPVRPGSSKGTRLKITGDVLAACRQWSSDKAVSLIFVGSMEDKDEEEFQWGKTSALELLQLWSRQARCTIAFTSHCALIGPPDAVRNFERILAKWKPTRKNAKNEYARTLPRVSLWESDLADVCDFLNRKADLKLRPLLKGDHRVWLDGQQLPIGVLIWSLAAAFGDTPMKVFGVSDYD